MTFTAKYTSECASCGEPVKPGQEAAYDQSDDVVHVICPQPVFRPSGKVCPKCHLEIPVSGRCDNCD